VGNIFYKKFDVVSAELYDSLNSHRTRYLRALRDDLKEAPRLLNSWQGHFENAINGASTIEALEQLQKIPHPTPRLAKKLAVKLTTLKGTAARAARRTSCQSATQAVASH
jgi:hypothetical protein